MNKFSHLFLAVSLLCLNGFAQETRSSVYGKVLDSQGGAIAGATITIRNSETGVTTNQKSNGAGYYEASLLLPGQYEVTGEFTGFKKLLRKGVTLSVSSRVEVELKLEIGVLSETVSVTSEAPLLEVSAVTSGRVLDNKTVMELPVMGNSAMVLVKLVPGIQTSGVNNYLALHSNAGASDYNVGGNVGGNSWTLDGSPNQGPGRRAAYLPYTDAVAEFKVETSNFDAGIGQTSGAAITMISKSGTNSLHGTATWQHWQQRWQGTPFFVKKAYFTRIAQAEAAGNKTLADQLRNTDKQPTGRSNNWGASAGGPVVIPKVYNGKNKLFWFFTYNAFKDVKNEDPSSFNRTVPSLLARQGDFSDMLRLKNAAQFSIYDPSTTRPDPARATHVIRTPFAGNIIPKSRFANPAYDAITKLYPNPNNPPAAGEDPVNNYLANATAYNWDYKAYSNRVDYQISQKFRMYGRWSFNDFGPEDRGDWTYETARGLNLNGLVRNNKGGNIDLVYTQNPTTIWDFNVAIDQFREGNIQPKALEFKASDIGLPTYIDQKAGDLHILPQMAVSGYSTISPGGISTWTRTRGTTAKVELTKIMGKHTVRAAFDSRSQYRTGGGGGNTSGNFTFSNTYTRKDDDNFVNSSNLGLGWAAFILGTPNGASIATNDNFALFNPYYGWFVQDTWRLTSKLTLNLGLRMEYELGATERYNRMITAFNPNLDLPIAAAAQAAYARNPIPELSASQFIVKGGNTYSNVGGAPRALNKNELMYLPRVGIAYQLGTKTVIRGGFGTYFDTLNVLNFGVDQTGFSRSTSPVITNDFGQTWNFPANANPNNGKSPLSDPFPVRPDGSRFDIPTRELLGAMGRVGRGFGFTDYKESRPRQQRWRAGFQRAFGSSMVIDVAYAGSYSDRILLGRSISPVPEQYWASGNVRNDAIANNLNANVTNPFLITNFNASQFSPLVWADMQINGFFTSPTIRKSTLLRAFPQMNNVTNNTINAGYNRIHEFQVNFERRFSKGLNFNVGYTAMKIRAADFFANEFDASPTERFSNSGRPHRLVLTSLYEMPFGKGRAMFANAPKAVNYLIGGWQTSVTYEYQPGPLLDWGNAFFNGSSTSNIANVTKTYDTWFNTADFEKTANKTANSFHRRVFPTRIAGVRADMTNQWNANMSKNITITERMNMQLRLDALNVANRSQMAGPTTDPVSTNFGRVTAQTQATNRWIQVQMRLTF